MRSVDIQPFSVLSPYETDSEQSVLREAAPPATSDSLSSSSWNRLEQTTAPSPPRLLSNVAAATTLLQNRQDDLEVREKQLNDRMAQFESLVRSTKLSLQEKLNETQRWQQTLEEREDELRTRTSAQEEKFRLDRNQLETDRVGLVARKTEIEERLHQRERELQTLVGAREKELTSYVDDYRRQLEGQLGEKVAEYQIRFDKRQKELESQNHVILEKEREKIALRLQELETEYQEKNLTIERDWNEKRQEEDIRILKKIDELQHQNSRRMEDAENHLRLRRERLEDEHSQRKTENEARFARREEQIAAREHIIREAEEEWQRRRDLFESQWQDYERVRQQRTDEFAARDAQLQERESYMQNLAEQIRVRESQLSGHEESLRIREHQTVQDAEKYRRIKEMEVETLEIHAEAARIREGLMRERMYAQKMLDAERNRLKETTEMTMRRLEEERKEVTSQNRKLEQVRTALDRSRDDLGRMHRETLEIRLAIEELWLQLSGEANSDELQESLHQIRARLADQYRDAVKRLELQKEELQTAKDQMILQQEQLRNRHEELDAWARNCESVLLEREQHLNDREQGLDHRQRSVDELIRKSHASRLRTEQGSGTGSYSVKAEEMRGDVITQFHSPHDTHEYNIAATSPLGVDSGNGVGSGTSSPFGSPVSLTVPWQPSSDQVQVANHRTTNDGYYRRSA